tara:strand:- start:727 stop:1032 length:306 start_codon:yes stop_codon:yes gene_type:complete
MNTKEMNKIRNKAKAILVEWLKTLLNKEEQKKVNVKNILTLLPNQTHYFSGETFRLQPWSYKWVVKKLKRNPELTIDDLNAMLQPSEKDLRRKEMMEKGPL